MNLMNFREFVLEINEAKEYHKYCMREYEVIKNII